MEVKFLHGLLGLTDRTAPSIQGAPGFMMFSGCAGCSPRLSVQPLGDWHWLSGMSGLPCRRHSTQSRLRNGAECMSVSALLSVPPLIGPGKADCWSAGQRRGAGAARCALASGYRSCPYRRGAWLRNAGGVPAFTLAFAVSRVQSISFLNFSHHVLIRSSVLSGSLFASINSPTNFSFSRASEPSKR